MDRFSECLPYVLKDEGGNDDDPHDPGGRTSRGIIQREYDVYRRSHFEATQDVWNASDLEIADIYKTQYWEPHCEQMPSGVDYILFDMNVNMGPVQAAKLLQRGLGVNADGHIGMITIHAVINKAPVLTINDVTKFKIDFYRSLKTFKYFGRGWLNRVASVQKVALTMV